MGHPIVAIWILLGTAILLALGSGGNKDDTVEPTKTPVVAQLEEVNTAKESLVKDEIVTPVTKAPLVTITNDVDKTAKKENIKSTSAPLKSELDNKPETNTGKNSEQISKSKSAETKESATTDLSQITSEEMLLMAREAYWNNGLDEAADIYMKLIEKEPKVLAHKGELGNVYWRQGYPKKAAELYSEIALPMIENDGAEKVANMIGFIGLFYPERAAEIHKKMQSKKSK
jgi:hypothetical protein